MYKDYFTDVDNFDDDYICHWGVKGMKWKDHVYKVEDTAKSGYKAAKKAAKAAYKSVKKKLSRLFESKAARKKRLAKERFNKAKKAGKAQAEAERNARTAANAKAKKAAARIKGEQAAKRIRNKQSAERQANATQRIREQQRFNKAKAAGKAQAEAERQEKAIQRIKDKQRFEAAKKAGKAHSRAVVAGNKQIIKNKQKAAMNTERYRGDMYKNNIKNASKTTNLMTKKGVSHKNATLNKYKEGGYARPTSQLGIVTGTEKLDKTVSTAKNIGRTLVDKKYRNKQLIKKGKNAIKDKSRYSEANKLANKRYTDSTGDFDVDAYNDWYDTYTNSSERTSKDSYKKPELKNRKKNRKYSK